MWAIFMRYIIILGLMILLANCAKTNGYYTKTAQSFEGQHVRFLIEKWGLPDSQRTENGNRVYLYKIESDRIADASFSPAIGVNPKGGPILVSAPPSDQGISLMCFTSFVVNKQGIIIDTRKEGAGC